MKTTTAKKMGPTVRRELAHRAAGMRGRIAAYEDERSIHQRKLTELEAAQNAAAVAKAEMVRLNGLIRELDGQASQLDKQLGTNGSGKKK